MQGESTPRASARSQVAWVTRHRSIHRTRSRAKAPKYLGHASPHSNHHSPSDAVSRRVIPSFKPTTAGSVQRSPRHGASLARLVQNQFTQVISDKEPRLRLQPVHHRGHLGDAAPSHPRCPPAHRSDRSCHDFGQGFASRMRAGVDVLQQPDGYLDVNLPRLQLRVPALLVVISARSDLTNYTLHSDCLQLKHLPPRACGRRQQGQR